MDAIGFHDIFDKKATQQELFVATYRSWHHCEGNYLLSNFAAGC